MANNIIGVIGGSGLYELDGLENVEKLVVDTPFGETSSVVTSGSIGDAKLLFIARHGIGHTLLPSEVNYQANIFALKKLGASWCISVAACGSLQEEIAPGHVLVPDQFIDRTKEQQNTFFGSGIVAHVPFADPFCPVLREELFKVADEVSKERKTKAHEGGTYVCMEGPAFSTRAESRLYRSWDAAIVGMTNLKEAKLAREAELAYATLGLVTDYDCWRSRADDVDVSAILAILKKNTDLAKDVIKRVSARLVLIEPSKMAANALQHAILTDPKKIPRSIKRELEPIIGKYLN